MYSSIPNFRQAQAGIAHPPPNSQYASDYRHLFQNIFLLYFKNENLWFIYYNKFVYILDIQGT